LKVGILIRPTSQKNLLTFGGDPILDLDSGSFLPFPNYCRIGDLEDLLAFSVQSPADFYDAK